jgi:hypothetical protein
VTGEMDGGFNTQFPYDIRKKSHDSDALAHVHHKRSAELNKMVSKLRKREVQNLNYKNIYIELFRSYL